ncbi:MAG TPA: ATP synthase F1 subunit delta [Bacteroidia bacterium]|jgi:F-type H+-transporting ATPase subunit delta|nr:ATP synthase F1 subunit delta [Bacteroidia bacterium]
METRVSQRYAKSLLDLSIEKGQLEQVYEDMQLVHSTVRENHDLLILMRSPVIKTDKKQEILKAIFGGKIGVITSEFIDIITRKRRENELEQIAESFIAQYKKNKNIITAVITTASGLDDKLRSSVMQVVKENSNAQIELVEKVNKDLIGGFVLRIGDKQVDSSIIRQIKELERNFKDNPYVRPN